MKMWKRIEKELKKGKMTESYEKLPEYGTCTYS